MSKAKDIAAEISTRLASITKAGGYLTDIGAKVLRGRRKLDEGQIPCVVVVEGDDVVEDRRTDVVKVGKMFYIEGHAPCDPDQPNDTGHDILADIKKAIFSGDPRLAGLAIDVEYHGGTIQAREDGLGIVAAGVDIQVKYVESPASP